MKKYNLLILISLVVSFSTLAQDKNNWGISFHGFIKNDIIYDTRQSVSIREGHFLLWPAPEVTDLMGNDINRSSAFNMLSIQSRLTGKISGPDAFGAKTSGLIEGAFFGQSEGDINGFRLRHAFMKLSWEHAELLLGQYWHPMFVTACFPDVVSFNTGVPFQPFARNPQVRFTAGGSRFKIMVAALTQRDFTSATGSVSQRNTGMPELDIQFTHNFKKGDNFSLLTGMGGSMKTLKPELVSDIGYQSNSTVKSYAGQGFVRIDIKNFTWKLEGVYGQNTYDLVGISSIGIRSVHPETGVKELTNTTSASIWTEFQAKIHKLQVGVFSGYTKNLGASGTIIPGSVYGSRSGVDYVYRISPRVQYSSGKVRFALEIEQTFAAFGTPDDYGKIVDSQRTANTRFLLASYYFF